MKEEREDEEQVQSAGTRRKFLRFMGMASVLPTAAFLEGCASKPQYPTGAKGGMTDPLKLKGGTYVKIKRIKPFPTTGRSNRDLHRKRIHWDFDRLINKIERLLKKPNSITGQVDQQWKQMVLPKGQAKKRNLGVNLNVAIEFIEAKSKPGHVGKMIIRGCMTRCEDTGKPIDNKKCDPNYSTCNKDGAEGDGIIRHHLYSSSMSSSSWA